MQRLECLDTSLPEDILAIQKKVEERVVGAEVITPLIGRALTRFRAGLAGVDRPVGAFLLLGPTGVGKTLTVEAVADILQGSPKSMLKVHCAEFRADHELARLKGAPPGYVGWKECTALLHQSKLHDVQKTSNPAVVLFDEIEKAAPALFDLLLGILDKGEIVLNDNTPSDFRKTIIFFTSNTGSKAIEQSIEGGMGFAAAGDDPARVAGKAAENVFPPEFRNRLTGTVAYRPLELADIVRVARIEATRLAERIHSRVGDPRGITIDDSAVELLARKGFDRRYGARHVKRALETMIEDPLANAIASGALPGGEQVRVVASGTGLVFLRGTP